MRKLCALISLFLLAAVPAYGILDSYFENFSNRNPNVTINGQDLWAVAQGGNNNAIVNSVDTPTGTGRSLEIYGVTPTVVAGRPSSYGNLTPTWVSYAVKAYPGGRQRAVPSSGIAAVCFDYSGKIMASNGTSWSDTGVTYDANTWYKVTLKLNFTTHKYDIYISRVTNPNVQFVPVLTNLQFIDTSVNSLSKFSFYGSYSSSGSANSFVDNISVSYIYRLEFVSTPQTIVQDGISGPMTVQLQNTNSEPQTAIQDYILDLKSSSATGRFSLTSDPWVGVTQITLPKFSQNATFYYKDSATGMPVITVAEYPEIGWLDALQQERIIPKTSHFEVLTTTPQVAGQNFQLAITAKDPDGNTDINYTGTIDLAAIYVSPSTGTKRLSVEQASGFVDGKLNLQISYPDAGTISISVIDHNDLSKSGTSGSILFLPAYFTAGADTPQAVNRVFNLTVDARNLTGELTPNYKGNMRLSPTFINPSSADGAALTPGTISGDTFIGGKAALAAGYNRWGSIKIKAEDIAYPSKFVETAAVKFNPQAVKVNVPKPPSGRDFFYIGETFPVDISVNDAAGNPIVNFTGQVVITAGPNFNLPSGYIFIIGDQGKHIFSVSSTSTGTFTISAREPESGLSAQSPPIVIKSATIQVIDTTSPIGTGEVLIQLVDDKGRVITTENNLEILVKLVEALDNVSASSPSTVTPVRFVNGQIRITVSDTEAEEVGIVPVTQLGLKIKSGKITFGRVAKSGIGTLMWREIKEKQEKKK